VTVTSIFREWRMGRWRPSYLQVPSGAIDDEVMRDLFAEGASLREDNVVMCCRPRIREAAEAVLCHHGICFEEIDYAPRPKMTSLQREIVLGRMERLNGIRWGGE